MMLYASSCERPSKSSARVLLPSSVSNSYSFSTGTQGRSRRFLLISSFRSACSASSLASSSRAACHSSWVPTLCSGISSPFVGLERCQHEPIPSSHRTLPGSLNETYGDTKPHRSRPRTAAPGQLGGTGKDASSGCDARNPRWLLNVLVDMTYCWAHPLLTLSCRWKISRLPSGEKYASAL